MRAVAAAVARPRPRSALARAASTLRAVPLPRGWTRPLARALLVALPAILLAYLSFASGGFFPLTIASVALVLGLALVVRVTVGAEPFESFGVALTVALGAIALLGAWMLASMLWGAAAHRAILEFDRLLLYLLGAALIGSVAWRTRERRWMLWLTVAAAFGVCVLALASRLLPATWTVGAEFATEPLNYPLGYTNALAIFAGMALVLAFHLTTDDRAPRVVRVLGAAAMPALAATVLLTFSRGGILVTVVALVAYVVLARSRGLVGGLLGVVPPTLYALSETYGADLVSPGLPTTPAALAQGGVLASSLALATLVAAGARAVCLLVDAGLARVPVSRRTWVGAHAAAAALAAVGVLVVFLSFDVPDVAARQYDRLVNGVEDYTSPRDRLTAPGASGRFDEWRVAGRAFREEPVVGTGAGSFQAVWAENRPVARELRDAHSLYFELASELGVVGLGLMLVAIGAILVGLLARCRGPDRAVYAALAAAWLAWAAHAGIDWDWEVPALTMPFLLLAAAGVAYRPTEPEPAEPAPASARARADERGSRRASARTLRGRAPRRRGPQRLTRVLVGVGLLALLTTPSLVAISQIRLESSLRAWKQGDCVRTIDEALGSLSALPVRPEPLELIAYCDSRFALNDLAEGAMRSAIARDRRSWDLWYGLALVHGAGRRDPRPAMAEAVRLNPLEPMTIQGARTFRTDDPDEWQRRALSAPLAIP